MVKIRTVTIFININKNNVKHLEDIIIKCNYYLNELKHVLEKANYEVQTVRIATNSIEDYTDITNVYNTCILFDELLSKHNIHFANIGPISKEDYILMIPDIIKNTSNISCSATGNNYKITQKIAESVLKIAHETELGQGNFKFCFAANCQPGIPFFPAGYHESNGKSCIGIGLECSDILAKAFDNCELDDAESVLKSLMENECTKIEKLISGALDSYKELKEEHDEDNNNNVNDIRYNAPLYNGIDVSMNPSLLKDHSIAFAYEKLKLGKRIFGTPGTLHISSLITRAIKSVNIKHCGYSGLMLPVCEDFGLCERANQQTYSVSSLLLYSSVCGVGLDTVPIAGDVTKEALGALYLDVNSMAHRLSKPLSCRMFPVPGRKAGEFTQFNSPYLHNCRILPL